MYLKNIHGILTANGKASSSGLFLYPLQETDDVKWATVKLQSDKREEETLYCYCVKLLEQRNIKINKIYKKM